MRGATCWTDHFLVRGKISLSLPKPSKRGQSTRPLSAYNLQYKETREFYQEELDKCLGDHPHVLECPAQQNWNTWNVALCLQQRQPDWFIQAADMLQPLLQAKQRAHNKMLHTNSTMYRWESSKELSRRSGYTRLQRRPRGQRQTAGLDGQV